MECGLQWSELTLMLFIEMPDAERCGETMYVLCTVHRRRYCNESSCINAISRNEKRKDEAAEDLGTFNLGTFTHMRNGAQADESARREAQEEADRARRDQSGVGLVVVARRTLRLRRRRRLLAALKKRDWCSDDLELKNTSVSVQTRTLTCIGVAWVKNLVGPKRRIEKKP